MIVPKVCYFVGWGTTVSGRERHPDSGYPTAWDAKCALHELYCNDVASVQACD